MDDIASVKSMLRAVLMSCKEGVAAHILQRDYREVTGEPLPFRKLGFSNLDEFIYSIPDVVQIRKSPQGEITYHAMASQKTAHIQNMVSKQRNAKKRRKLIPAKRRPAPHQSFVPRAIHPRGFHPTNQYKPSNGHGPVSMSDTKSPDSARFPEHDQPSRYTRPSDYSRPSYSNLQVRLSDSARKGEKRSVTFDQIGQRTLNKAMADANKDSREGFTGFGSRFDVPPRFRKLQQPETSPGARSPLPKIPAKKSPPRLEKAEFETVPNGRQFYERLEKYARLNFDVTSLSLEFTTLPVKIESSQGFVSSLTFSGKVYGSEDAFSTPEEATYAVARKVCQELDSDPRRDKRTTGRTVPSVEESLLRSRVKELLSNKANGVFKKRLFELYKARYKESPPDDMLRLLHQWKDVASILESAVPDNEIITPVSTSEEIPRPVKPLNRRIITYRPPTPPSSPPPVSPRPPTSKPPPPSQPPAPSLPSQRTDVTAAKPRTDIYSYKDLEIPKGESLLIEEKVTVYITFIHTCGSFCIQREDSPIEEISAMLAEQATLKLAKPTRQELTPGRFCASMYSSDGSWSRAEVLAKDDIGCGVEVLYVDFGNTEKCFPSSMLWLSEAAAAFPVQAVYCSLYGIRPLQGEDWSEASQKKFAELTQEALFAVTHSYTDQGVCEVELFYSRPDQTTSINDMLIAAELVRGMEAPADPSVEPEPLVIPDAAQWDVYVSYVISSTESVTLRLVGEHYSEKLEELETKLEVAFQEAPDDGPITVGGVCVAYVDELYHRVRVLENQDEKIQCHFLDHGDTDDLTPDQLRVLDPELNKSVPYQAIEVSLYGLEEFAENITVLEKLFDLALGKTCVAEVVSRVDCLSVILFDTFGLEDVNINDLILKNYQDEEATSLLPSHSSPLGTSLLDRPSDITDKLLDSESTSVSYVLDSSIDTSPSVKVHSDEISSQKTDKIPSDTVSSQQKDKSQSVDSHPKYNRFPSVELSPDSSYIASLCSKLETSAIVGESRQKLTPAEQFSQTPSNKVTSLTSLGGAEQLISRQKSSDSWETEESEEEIGDDVAADENASEDSETTNQNSTMEDGLNLSNISDEKFSTVSERIANVICEMTESGDKISIGENTDDVSKPRRLYTWGLGRSHRVENTQGEVAEPQWVDTQPQGVETQPQGVETQPQGVETQPQGVETQPQGEASQPQGMATESQGAATEDMSPYTEEALWDTEVYAKRPCPSYHTLPSVGEFCDIHIGLVFDPSNFVCTPFDYLSDLQQMHQRLNDWIEEKSIDKSLKEDDIKLDHLYAGLHHGCWYRTMTRTCVGPDLFSVYYPDLGEFNIVDSNELQPLPWEFWSLPFQAFKAKLDAIRPAGGTGLWTEGAIFKMKELTEGRNLVGLIRSVDENRVVSLQLVDTSQPDIDVCVEDVLTEFGFAELS